MKFVSNYHVPARWRLRLCMGLLCLQKNDEILDAGCGEGLITYEVSKKTKRVVGVDISEKTIEANSRYASDKMSFLAADLNDLDEKLDSRFDKIICLDVLEHAHGFENIVRNFGLLLKSGGEFLATIPVGDHGHFEYNDPDLIKKIFNREGLKLDKLEYVKTPFFTRSVSSFINLVRKVTGQEMKEVDSFEETQAFNLRENETIVFKLYKVFFTILFMFTYLDVKLYSRGNETLLVKAKKE